MSNRDEFTGLIVIDIAPQPSTHLSEHLLKHHSTGRLIRVLTLADPFKFGRNFGKQNGLKRENDFFENARKKSKEEFISAAHNGTQCAYSSQTLDVAFVHFGEALKPIGRTPGSRKAANGNRSDEQTKIKHQVCPSLQPNWPNRRRPGKKPDSDQQNSTKLFARIILTKKSLK